MDFMYFSYCGAVKIKVRNEKRWKAIHLSIHNFAAYSYNNAIYIVKAVARERAENTFGCNNVEAVYVLDENMKREAQHIR